MLSRETDVGLTTFAGQVVWARVFELELHVQVLDDVSLTRVADERTGLPILEAKRLGSALKLAAEPSASPAPSPAAAAAPAASSAPVPAPAAPHNGGSTSFPKPGAAMPQRPQREVEEQEEEPVPDAGDVVLHFHFGECLVVSSIGEKIRIRQDKPGSPVLDVSLTKLRVELLDAAPDGTKRFKLHRKN
jgi:hypothetical protein